jgi:hypothetical protein
MFRGLFSRRWPAPARPSYRPTLEGLESRWTPATFAYNATKQLLTVTASPGDIIDFSQDSNNPAGHISVTSTTDSFNDSVPTRFVKSVKINVPAGAGVVDLNFSSFGIAGSLTINSAAATPTVVLASEVFIAKNFTFTSLSANTDETLLMGSSVFIGGNLIASLRGGSNEVELSGNIGGNATIIGGGGQDQATLDGLTLGGKAGFSLGGGNNQLTSSGDTDTIGKGLVYQGGAADDTVGLFYMGGELNIGGSVSLSMGGGSNAVDLGGFNRTDVGGSLAITGGVDVALNGLVVGKSANIELGNSSFTQKLDVGELDQVFIMGGLSVTGGSQTDELNVQSLLVFGNTTIQTLGGGDSIGIDDTGFLGNLTISAGGGNDFISLETDTGLSQALNVGGKVSVLGGADFDTLQLGNAFDSNTILVLDGANAIFNGGPGSNVISNDLGTLTDNGTAPTFLNWGV